jgi:hypothetical protein
MSSDSEIVEMLWDCTACQSKGILGRHTSCPHCGASVPSGDPYYEDPNAKAITDPELLKLDSGRHWKCPHCEGMERNINGSCARCSAAREPTRPESPRSQHHTPESSQGMRYGSAPNPITRERVFYGALGLAGVAVIGLVVWGFQSHDEAGTVTAKAWTRQSEVQAWTKGTGTGWQEFDRLTEKQHIDPVGGTGEVAGMENIRDCTREQRTTKQVRTGSHQECHTASIDLLQSLVPTAEAGTTSHGNGFGSRPSSRPTSSPRSSPSRPTSSPRSSGSGSRSSPAPHVPVTVCHSVDDYVSVPVYDYKCQYDTWRWQTSYSKTETGAGASVPKWPDIHLLDLQRELRQDRYSVTFTSTTDADHTIIQNGEAAFSLWSFGDSVVLTVTNFGTVSDVRKP